MNVSIQIEGGNELRAAFKTVEAGLLDLRKLGTWDTVATEFRKIEKEIFGSEGAQGASGKWEPLSVPYAARKTKKWGSVPILQASGRLYKSLTQRGGPDAVYETAPQEMTIGTKVPYAGYHQTGTNRMQQRKPVDLTDAHVDRLAKSISQKVRQLAANARLQELKGL